MILARPMLERAVGPQKATGTLPPVNAASFKETYADRSPGQVTWLEFIISISPPVAIWPAAISPGRSRPTFRQCAASWNDGGGR